MKAETEGLSAPGSTARDETPSPAGALLASLLTMAWFVEARDPYTGGHLWRVSRLSHFLADRAGFSASESARIALGGFLHDLGKIGVPDAVLRKPDRLTDDEFAHIKTHPDIGLRLLAGHPLAPLVKAAVHCHHERPDGKGYPQGLAASSIPEAARIVGICDAFDAMTSHRPYRPGMPRNTALSILNSERGTQFDAYLTGLFIELGEAGFLDHVIRHSDEGIPLQDCPMCGPTLALQRGDKSGDRVYCRNCAGEFELIESGHALVAQPTGRKGGPQQLQARGDPDLIRRTVESIVEVLPSDLTAGATSPLSAYPERNMT